MVGAPTPAPPPDSLVLCFALGVSRLRRLVGLLTVAVCFRRVFLSRGLIRFAVVLRSHPMRLRCSFVMLGSLIVRGLRHVHFQFCHCTTDVQ